VVAEAAVEEEEEEEEMDREPEAEDDEDDEDLEEEVEDGEIVVPTKVMASDLLVSWPALQIICCASLFCFRMASTLNSFAFVMEVLVCILHFLV
jgi:hypothetical protein